MYHPSLLKQSTRDRLVPHSDPLTLVQKLAAKQKSLAGYLHLVQQYQDKKPLWASINQKAADKVQAEIVSLEQAIKLANETYALEAPTEAEAQADESVEIGSWLPTAEPLSLWEQLSDNDKACVHWLIDFADTEDLLVAMGSECNLSVNDMVNLAYGECDLDGTDNSAAAEMRNAGYGEDGRL